LERHERVKLESQFTAKSMSDLASQPYLPYLDDLGELPQQLQRQIGVYAIFDADQNLQLVDYSRDVLLSLKQHLVRQPDLCHWVKVHVIDKPNRTVLENIKNAWLAGATPPGNGEEAPAWQEPIDCRFGMTATEQAGFAELEELAQSKLLKQVARRVEADIMNKLAKRGLRSEIRFNPKAKDRGLLDLA
jgi:hypothetical protein